MYKKMNIKTSTRSKMYLFLDIVFTFTQNFHNQLYLNHEVV